jgi:hypothetical protein
MVAANHVEMVFRWAAPALLSHGKVDHCTSVLLLHPSRPFNVKSASSVQRVRANARLGRSPMQVLVRRSEFRQDVRCSVCGQGFRLYWEPNSPAERATMRSIVSGELRDHHSRQHGGDQTASAHPFDLFRLPGWAGSPQFSRSSMLAGPSRPAGSISRVVMISQHAKKRSVV